MFIYNVDQNVSNRRSSRFRSLSLSHFKTSACLFFQHYCHDDEAVLVVKLSLLCLSSGLWSAPRGRGFKRTRCSCWWLSISTGRLSLTRRWDKTTQDRWDLDEYLQRHLTHSGMYRPVTCSQLSSVLHVLENILLKDILLGRKLVISPPDLEAMIRIVWGVKPRAPQMKSEYDLSREFCNIVRFSITLISIW